MTTKATQKSILKPIKKEKSYKEIKRKRVNIFSHEFYDWSDQKLRPVPDAFLHQLSERLRYWVEKYHVITINSFCADHYISQTQYFDWVNRFPALKQAHEYALTVIGVRREVGGLTKKLDSGSINSTMSMYSKMHKDHAEWHYRMKAAVNAKVDTERTKYIIVNPTPDSKLVPSKEDDDD